MVGMSVRSINSIDYRIARLQAMMKRLRAERRLAILREKQREIKFSIQENARCTV
jgi:hypothetical protein